MKCYELMPKNGQKSFYGKAVIAIYDNGTEVLESYGTPIMYKAVDGTMGRYYDGWTQTTGKHIKAFCGLDKAGFMGIPMEEYYTNKNMDRIHAQA